MTQKNCSFAAVMGDAKLRKWEKINHEQHELHELGINA
jgi:hypothetical protein